MEEAEVAHSAHMNGMMELSSQGDGGPGMHKRGARQDALGLTHPPREVDTVRNAHRRWRTGCARHDLSTLRV